MRPVVILGAMEGEIRPFRIALEQSKEISWRDRLITEGTLAGKKCVVTCSGVGKVMTAMVTQRCIDKYSPSALIYTGIGGSINREFIRGDIVLGKDSMQHDLDASPFRYKRGEIPYSGYRIIEADEKLLTAAMKAVPQSGTIRVGRILTGDQFISDFQSPERSYLTEELKGDCVDMEGSAAALVCRINNLPHLIIRSISDNADGKEKINLREFLKLTSENSLHIVKQILEILWI